MKLRWTALALCLVAAVPCAAQQQNRLQLGGPLVLKMKDLGADWLRVRVEPLTPVPAGMGDMMSQLAPLMAMSQRAEGPGKGGKPMPEGPEAMLGMQMLSSLFGGGKESAGVYYTQGRLVDLGGRQFLVAYQREQSNGGGFGAMMGAMFGAFAGAAGEGLGAPAAPGAPGAAPPGLPGAVNGDTPVYLSLINLAGVGALREIRPFDLQREIAEASAGGAGLLPYLMLQQKGVAPAPVQQAVPAKPAPVGKTAPRKP